MNKRVFTERELSSWVTMYANGDNSCLIADIYNTSSNVVCRHLRKRGVTIRTKSEVRCGELNPMWRGDEVGYGKLHRWVERRMPEKICNNCSSTKSIDLANKGVYDRNLDNWEWLCRKCHMLSDGRMKNLVQYQ